MSRRSSMLLVIPALAVGLMSSACSRRQPPEPEVFREGLQALQRYDWVAAENRFRQLSQVEPESPWGAFGVALVRERQLLTFDALHELMRLTAEWPSFPPAHKHMVRLYQWADEPERALSEALLYADLRPSDLGAYVLVARAALAMDDLEQAAAALERARDLETGDRSDIVALAAAQYLFRIGQVDSAVSIVQRVTAGTVREPAVAAELAAFYETSGRVDSALYWGRQAVDLSEEPHDAAVDQFFRALRLGCLTEARRIRDWFAAGDTSGLVASALTVHYELAAERAYAAAKAAVRWREAQGPYYTPVYYDIQARWLTHDAISIAADREQLPIIMKRDSALEQFRDFMEGRMALKFAPYTNIPTDLVLLRKSGAWQEGLRDYRLAEIYLLEATGNSDSADGVVGTFTGDQLRRPDWLTGLGDIYAVPRVGRREKAESAYRKALDIDSLYRPAFSHWVAMLMRGRHWQAAVSLFGRYPHFSRLYPEDAVTLGVCYARMGEWDRAADLWRANLPMLSCQVGRWDELITLCTEQGQFDMADELVELLLKLQGENPDAFEVAARYRLRREAYAQALATAERGLALDSSHVGLGAIRAAALYRTGKKEEALERFSALLERAPGDVRLMMLYSRVAVEDPRRRGMAMNLARSAVFYGGRNVETLLNLCAVYWEVKRYDLVRGEARKAVKLDDYNPMAHYWLGKAQYRLDNPAEARKELSRAVELGLRGDALREARRLLERL